MAAITVERVQHALGTVIEPELHKDLITLGMVKDIEVTEKSVSFTITLTTPACPLKTVIHDECEKAVRSHIPETEKVAITFDSQVREGIFWICVNIGNKQLAGYLGNFSCSISARVG